MGKNKHAPIINVEPMTLINNCGMQWRSIYNALKKLKKLELIDYNIIDAKSSFGITLKNYIGNEPDKSYIHIPFDFVWKGYSAKIKNELAILYTYPRQHPIRWTHLTLKKKL
jgi:hypothetical protein